MAEVDVLELANRKLTLSVRRLADVFEMGRDTVARRLAEYDVQPSGERNGHPVYALRPAAEAILGLGITGPEGIRDPSQLPPEKRRAWYQSENERLKVEQEKGNLILATEVQFEMSNLAKIVVRFLETLPDVTERDLRCGPEVVEYLSKKVRELRADIADAVGKEDAEMMPAVIADPN